MKSFAYRTIATLATIGVWLTERLYVVAIWVANYGLGIIRYLIVQGSVLLMRLIDADMFDEAQAELLATMELEQQKTELELLSQASKLKEHALEIGEWTDSHTEALEAIGNALMEECDWDEEHIHQYLKDVVEDGTDLKYNVDPWDDDED